VNEQDGTSGEPETEMNESTKPLVGIIMGSKSDWPTMKQALRTQKVRHCLLPSQQDSA